MRNGKHRLFWAPQPALFHQPLAGTSTKPGTGAVLSPVGLGMEKREISISFSPKGRFPLYSCTREIAAAMVFAHGNGEQDGNTTRVGVVCCFFSGLK